MIFAAITLSLQLQRTSLDLLDGLNIELVAHNSSEAPADVRFPIPAEYAIDVLRDGTLVWTSLPSGSQHAGSIPPHTKRLPAGPTVLAIYIWNEETLDGRSPAPGAYIVRARLLGDVAAQASTTLKFIAPTPVSALAALHIGDEVTISGRIGADKETLTDSTGTITLTKKLLGAPSDAPVVVRGYVAESLAKTRVFFVERWAMTSNS